MKKNTNTVIIFLTVFAWVAFVGYMVEGGALLWTYIMSLIWPETAADLYKGLNMSTVHDYNLIFYSTTIILLVVLSALKADIAYKVIQLLTRIREGSPFRKEVTKNIDTICNKMLTLWIMTVAYNLQLKWLTDRGVAGLENKSLSIEFILVVMILYVFAQVIMKRGMEIESENELTV